MRGKNTVTGRFTIPFELNSISDGIEEDNGNPLNMFVDWWRYSKDSSSIDPIYDVGDYDGGRVWKPPVRLRIIRQTVNQGPVYPNDRGFYTQDDMTFIVNEREFRSKLPHIPYEPDPFLKDRITWRGKVFHPFLVNPRAHLYNTAVTVAINATQVNPEELVNDPQWNWIFHKVEGPFHPSYWDTHFLRTRKEATDVTREVNYPTRKEDLPWSEGHYPPDDVYST